MSEIRFYHLQNQTIEQALPALVAKAHETGQRILIKTPDEITSEKINEALWTYRADSFLPHGNDKDGNAEHQPIWITHNNGNANNASVLIVAGGTETAEVPEGITLHCEMFLGSHDEERHAARSRWKSYKESGAELTYWQQNERGGWDKKA